MDASNLLKPALARGKLRAVGATTLKEYQKHVEKDAALERRFQPVLVTEPTPDDAIAILRGIKEKYEIHHGVRITDPAIISAVNLSVRYITDRFLPDKAIDLIDEATSALDNESEVLVQEAIERLMEHRTTFVIAHRLSTIRNADVIIVLEKGRIVQSGKHEVLIKDNEGIYKKLYELQFKHM